MNTNIWEYSFTVRSFDVDSNKNMTPVAISEYLQEVAGEHANTMGFGYRQFVLQNMVWILSGIKIEVERLPVWEEKVFIKTWIVGNDKFTSRRDFQWLDADGNVLINASTNWVLFNTQTRRPQLVERMSFAVEMFPDNVATSAPVANIRGKIDNENPLEYMVRYSDLDMIGHMNNTKYIQLLIDSYGEDFNNKKRLKAIDINFKTEAKFDELLLLQSKQNTENEYIHELKKAADGRVNCLAVISWK